MQKKLYVDDFSAFGEAYFAHIVRLQSPVVVQKEGFEQDHLLYDRRVEINNLIKNLDLHTLCLEYYLILEFDNISRINYI